MALSRLLPASFEQPNPVNFVINGNMNCYQRGSVSKSTNSWGYTLDRWELSNYIDDTITVTQDSDVPTGQGFGNSMKITGSSGDNSLDSADYLTMVHKFEGQNLQSLKKGTSSAKPMTFSFWIKATTTGTYIVEFADNDNTRKVSKSYTVSASNTWEYKTITVEADTTGTLDNDNNTSIWIQMWFVAGSNFTGGSLNSSWTSSTTTNTRVVGQVNGMSSSSHNIYLTGVCLNEGSHAISFPHESYGETLQKCHRYFCKSYRIGDPLGASNFVGLRGTDQEENNQGSGYRENYDINFPVRMRSNPTITIYDSSGNVNKCNYYIGATSTPNKTLTVNNNSDVSFGGYNDRTTTIGGWQVHFGADAEL